MDSCAHRPLLVALLVFFLKAQQVLTENSLICYGQTFLREEAHQVKIHIIARVSHAQPR